MDSDTNNKLHKDNSLDGIIAPQNTVTQDKYSIFNYFKEHPSFFIAIASALVAIISFALQFTTFLTLNSYLYYFDFNNEVATASSKFTYFIATSFAYVISLFAINGLFSKTFDFYVTQKRKILYFKYTLKAIRKEHNVNNRVIKARLRKIKKNKILQNCEHERLAVEQTKEDLCKKERIFREKYNQFRKDILFERILGWISVILSFLVAWLVIAVICFLMFSINMHEWTYLLKAAAFLSIIIVSVNTLISWFFYCELKISRKSIKKDAIDDSSEKYFADNALISHPLVALIKGNVKTFFSDANCKRAILGIISSLMLLMFLLSRSGIESASNQRSFYIVQHEEVTYAVIYINSDSLLLEKAEIDGTNLCIDTREQKIIERNGVVMKKYVFDSVELIKTNIELTNTE